MVPCTGPNLFCKWVKNKWYHKKKKGDVTRFVEGYFYVGCQLISISYFLANFGDWKDMTLNEYDQQWRSSSFNFSYLICKVTGQSGHRSFITNTCPFVTVRTAGPLAPILAQHKMWNRDPKVTGPLGERDGHMAPPLFHWPTPKKGPGPVHGTMPLQVAC